MLLYNVGEDDNATTSSQPGVERDTSSQYETDPPSTRVKAPPPPPLDLGIGEEEHVVPSQSDVMDILSVASKGANDITAENLKKVCEMWYPKMRNFGWRV